MWLFERMKTGRHIAQPAPTQRRLVLYVLDQDGNGLDDLNLDLVAAVLFDNADDVL